MKRIPGLLQKKIVAPFIYFIQDSRAVGIILLCCTALSLLLANSLAAPSYLNIIHSTLSFSITSPIHLPQSFLHWINDGLMAFFFFMAGMEIKRELSSGSISTFSKAILPLVAAVGGMLVPATIFFLFNKGTAFAGGWGIPMASDIAFSLGIASLLGSRAPLGLKIFLTALAIIDDLGAIAAIALFYSAAIHWWYLLGAAIILVILLVLLRFNRFGWFNYLLGILLWYFVYNSGIHATIAGVLFAALIPVDQLHHIENRLKMPVNFIVLPLFALANTAIIFPEQIGNSFQSTLSWGIILGLVMGKPLGIFCTCFIAVKMKWGQLPDHTSLRHILGAGLLAGIGFTMSIFIASLAFTKGPIIDIAKIAVLTGSGLSILMGITWIKYFCKPLPS